MKTGGPCLHYIAHLSARAHKYTHLRHEESKESMLNHIPSSRNNSLNHVLDWEKVLEKCKTHQDNYSDKDSKCNVFRFVVTSCLT